MVNCIRKISWPFNQYRELPEGEEVELKKISRFRDKKLAGAFKIENIRTIEEIIESDIFENGNDSRLPHAYK